VLGSFKGLVIKPIQVKEIYNGLSAMFQNDASVSTMKMRSKTLPQINWNYCIFCRQKAIKKDRKLKRIESIVNASNTF
jgi:hypothetical protein